MQNTPLIVPRDPGTPARAPVITCISFQERRSGPTLLGYADVHVGGPFKFKLYGLSVPPRAGPRWACLPSRPVLDREGKHARDDAGKLRFVATMAWDSARLTSAFSNAVVEAVARYDRSVFQN